MASESQSHATAVLKDRTRRHGEHRSADSLSPSSPQVARARSPGRHHREGEHLSDKFPVELGFSDGNIMRPVRLSNDPFGPPSSMVIPPLMINKKTTNADVQVTKKEFRIDMDVSDFAPEELDVKIIGDHMVIKGNHKEHPGENANFSRHFCRRYTLPEDIIVEDVTVFLAKTGMMCVKVPRKTLAEERHGAERKPKVKFQEDEVQS
ncbi:alpha-crystallin B chain-like [Asterias rubens]|uniref:alpha-crystallin B chain-like n=1 Tax=Asterias rubens TaxID=7604 RepID=UPI001455A4E4|nr:alpha-crystallin B chain-like [Asterias rubens]